MKKMISFLLLALMLLGTLACQTVSDSGVKPRRQFAHNGATLEIDDPAESITESFGQPRAYDEEPSCPPYTGVTKIYVYSDFTVQAYTVNGKDYFVQKISLTNDLVATEEGIAIGDSKERVISVYGDGYEEFGASIYYVGSSENGDPMHLQFVFRDGKVANVYYLKESPKQ